MSGYFCLDFFFFCFTYFFCDFSPNFLVFFSELHFITHLELECIVQPEHIVTITIFKNFGFFLKEVSLRSSLTQLPYPSLSSSCFPFTPAPSSFLTYPLPTPPSITRPTSYPTFTTMKLVSIHEVMF